MASCRACRESVTEAMATSAGKVADKLKELTKSSLVRDDSGSRRVYRGDDGHIYHSVTSIISATDPPEKQEAIAAWLARPGSEQTRQMAAERGTKAHSNAEFIAKVGRKLAFNAARKRNVWKTCDDGLERCPPDITQWALKKAAATAPRVSWSSAGWARGLRHFLLDRITAIHGAELKVYDKTCSAAGTFDLLADVDGALALVDWKTSSRYRDEKMFESYKVQAAAYRRLLRSVTGIEVPGAWIVVATRSGPPQELFMDQYDLNLYEVEFELRCSQFQELVKVENEKDAA